MLSKSAIKRARIAGADARMDRHATSNVIHRGRRGCATFTGKIEATKADTAKPFAVELKLPSPNDAREQEAFRALVALRDAEWCKLVNRKG